MSTAALVPASTRNALMVLGDDEVVVGLDAGGYLVRAQRKLKLFYGPDLYAAVKGTPQLSDKVQPYQPGYMRQVAACGGQLACPPVMRDPVTGQPTANPRVEVYPGTGLIRQVSATAVCVVPNPTTGQLHANAQTITLDAEHVLRQAMLKIDRDDCVRMLSDDDVAAAKKAGELTGWTVIPLMPPYANICANMAKSVVREAIQTFQNQSGTIRQRACSKAERLAADHNPITRWTTTYGELLVDLEIAGRGRVNGVTIADRETVAGTAVWKEVSGYYAELDVVAWVQHQGRAELDTMLSRLATAGEADGVASVVVGAPIDVTMDDGPDDTLLLEDGGDVVDFAQAAAAATPAREPVSTRQGPQARPQSAAPTHVHVAAEPAIKATSKPAAVPVAEPAATGVSTAHATLLKRVLSLEVEVTEAIGLAAVMDTLTQMGLRAEEVNTSDLTEAQLRDYQARLTDLLR